MIQSRLARRLQPSKLTQVFHTDGLERQNNFREIEPLDFRRFLGPLAAGELFGRPTTIEGPGEADFSGCVDEYDCIVVDECHRGYLLDRELSETELGFRSFEDYISKNGGNPRALTTALNR